MSGGALAGLLPQKGEMSLLDEVVEWDARHIVCTSARHTGPAHPLSVGGRVSALVAVEMAAQAMAAHAALAYPVERKQRGVVARLRDCTLHCERIDNLPGSLRIDAEHVASGLGGFSYRCTVRAGDTPVLAASLLIALSASGEA